MTSEQSVADQVKACQRQTELCMRLDGIRLRARLRNLKKIKEEDKQLGVLAKIRGDLDKAIARREARVSRMPAIDYPAQLPVSQRKEDIAKAIAEHQVVIVAGETGSGKTTQLPKICMELGRGITGLIGHTQPRRLAARSVAERIAAETGSALGTDIGYRVRFADKMNDNTYVKLMTDGILLAEIQNDPYLNRYDTLIIDEAHERSLNIDFLLGYLKRLLPKRPDLKLIITSATIDTDRFASHFDNAPVVEVSGRTYPVEVRYHVDDDTKDHDQLQAIFDAVDELVAEGPGDILIFMNGEREIRDTADALSRRNLRDTEVLPLFARLSYAEQSKIFKSHRGRRIVLATNVAETSLTVPGIRYVIDPGTARISRYSYRTKVQRLPIEPISQASANQRKGRCGRVADGICIRLYSEEDFNNRPEFTDPEILRTNLAAVILQMLSLGLGDIEAFPFVQPPDSRNITDGLRLLEEIGAIVQGKRGEPPRLSPLGQDIAALPIDPRLARMVIQARDLGCLHQLMVISAALSIQDPRERPLDFQQQSDQKHRRFFDKDSDFIAFVNLWDYLQQQQRELSNSQFRKMCRTDFLSYLRVREWQDLYSQLKQVLEERGITVRAGESSYDAIHQSILSGMLSHVGFKDNNNEFQGARNSKFFIFPGSALAKKSPKWVVVAELVETSRLFGRVAAKINPEWIEPLAQHLIKRSYSEPHYERRQGSVMAYEQLSLYGLIIVAKRKCQYGPINASEAREIFIRRALVEGELGSKEKFFVNNLALVEQVEELEHKSRRRDILVDEESLFQFYDHKLPEGIFNQRRFAAWWKKTKAKTPDLLDFDLDELMRHDATRVTSIDFPDRWQQDNLVFALSYKFEPGEIDDGVSVHIPLPLLNQVQANGFDWLVGGLLADKVVALIKSLPKSLRRNFVPAPNYADACLQAMAPGQLPLLEAMAKHLLRMSGIQIPKEAWDLSQLPAHLQMNFKVEQDNGKLVAQGRDLEALQQQLSGKVQKSLAKVAKTGIEQQGLTEWTFGELPASYSRKQGNFEIKAYPALVAGRDSVDIKLFDSPESAAAENRLGLRRLVLLNVPSPIQYLQRSLPNRAKLGLYYNAFGQVTELIDDCIAAGADQLITRTGTDIREAGDFDALREQVRAELGDTVVEVAKQVERILTLAHGIQKKLKGKVSLEMVRPHGDIKSQLSSLIFKGFVSTVGVERLADMERYLKAVERRLEKLKIDATRDRINQQIIESLTAQYLQLHNKLVKGDRVPEKLDQARWMIEELRVSLFAQTLGTRYPVSEKRVKQLLAEIAKG